MIYLELFWSFLQIGLFSIGGGYAAIPFIQAQTVDIYGWMSMNEFADLVTVAEMTPGPIAVNAATFVGSRVGGIPGAVVATLGCILPSIVIVSLLAVAYEKFCKSKLFDGAFKALRPAVTALIAAAGVSLLIQALCGGIFDIAEINIANVVIFAVAIFVLRKYKTNPIIVMLSCGIVGLGVGVIIQLTALK